MSTLYADTANETPRPKAAPMSSVLRSRRYLLLWTAQLLSMVAGFFNYVAVAWLVLQITGSSLAMGSVLAAAAVPAAVFMLLGGVASDRFSPRNTMLAAGLLRGAVMAVVAGLALTHSVRLWELFAAAVLVGTTSAFFVPASTSMVPRLLAEDQLEAGNGLLNLSRTAAMVLGSASAGVVVSAAGAGTALAADAAASVLAALLVVLLPKGGVLAAGGNPLADLRDGVLLAWRDVPLRAVLLVVSIINLFALGAIEVGLPALAHQRFGQGAAALGGAFAAWGLGSTVGAIAAGTRPAPARFGRLMIVLVALMGAGIAATGLSSTLPLLLVVMVVMGVVEGAGTTYLFSWMQRRTDPALQGRVMSLAMLASVGLEPVALAAAGALAARELGLLFWVCAAGLELTALLAAANASVRKL
jgi:MFS family permease